MGRPRKPSSGVGKRIESLVWQDEKLSEFAARIGAPSSTIGSYIRGEREPSLSFLERLHIETNVDLNWLVSGSDEEARDNALATSRGPTGISAGELAQGKIELTDGSQPTGSAGQRSLIRPALDHELMGKCVEAVFLLFGELSKPQQPFRIGRLASELYDDVVSTQLKGPEEQQVAIKSLVARLRREIGE